MHRQHPADAEMGAEIRRIRAVARAEVGRGVVCLCLAEAEGSFHVAPARKFLTREHAAARVARRAAAVRAVVEIAVIVAVSRLEERAPGERARLVRVLLRDARVERRAPRIDMRARLVAHVRAAARPAERAEAVRAIREPRNLRQRRIDEVVAAHVDDIALRRARLDRRLRVGVDCDTRRARSRRAAGAVRIAGAACAVRIFRAAGVARFARTAGASRAAGTTRAARAARAAGAACRYGFRCEDEVLVIFVRHGARELCRDADEDIDFLVDCRVREQIAAALFLDEIDFFGFLEIRAAIRMDVDRATPHVGIFVRREMEQDVVCLRLGGEIEMVRVEVRDIASLGRPCDVQRVAARSSRYCQPWSPL